MNDWTSTILGELCQLKGGSGFKTDFQGRESGVYPFIKVSDMNLSGNERKIHTANNWVSSDDLKQLKAKAHPAGSVVFAKIGIALTYNRRRILTQPTIIDNNMMAAISNAEKVDAKFLYYLLTTIDFNLLVKGSALPYINASDVAAVAVSLPPLPEQRAIASILGSLDEQIEGLRRQNATLEQVAQVVFRAWFVDFEPVKAKQAGIAPACLDAQTAALFPADFEDETKKLPRGWKNGCLQNFIDFALGGDWGKDEATATETEAGICVRGADIPALQNGGVGKMPLRYLKSSSLVKRSLQDGDLIIEISGGSPTQSTGRPVLVTKGLLSQLEHPLITSNFCRMVRLKEKNRARFVYLWLRDLYSQNILMQYETGTTGIKNFGFARFIEHAPLIMAPDSVMQAFDDLVAPLYEKIGANGAQARTLAQIRDALLPRLLSGSLRVPESLVCAFDFGDSVHSDAEFELQLG